MLTKKNLHTRQNRPSFRTPVPLVNLSRVLMILFALLSGMSSAQTRILDSSLHHLRNGTEPEWDEFANSNPKKELVVFFHVSGKSPQTLSITQYDVKQNWNVLLNDHKV